MFALRGAISVSKDDAAEVEAAAAHLTTQLLVRNGLNVEDIVSAYFTATTDLTSAFPAAGARRAGFESVPMLCAQEIPVPGALPRIIRVMLHVHGTPRQLVRHVYLGDAVQLRPDWAARS